MNIIKKKKRNYIQVANAFLRNKDLSFKAKGLFCYMFSMADNWNFTIKSIAKQQKDGETSIINAMNELKKYGFIIYTKHKNGTGTYYLDDEPKLENPNLGFPNLGKSTPIKKEQLDKKKIDKKEKYKKENPNLNIEAYTEWLEYKKYKSKAPITKTLNFLSKYPKETQQQIVDTSIMNGYKGLFPPKQQFKKTLDEKNNEFLDKYFDEAIDTEVIK